MANLVQVRAADLEPGQRMRPPRARRFALVLITDVATNEYGSVVVGTDAGAYVCDPNAFVDVEDCAEVCG